MVDQLMAGHRRFRAGFATERAELLAHLHRDGQRPSTLWIGCSDSRVIPELLTDALPGDLFVVRNIANRVPVRGDADTSVGAAIEFALDSVGVGDIVVCGHDDCGGVTAVYDDLDGIPADADLARWLGALRHTIEPIRDAAPDRATGLRRAVEANVRDSLANLLTYPSVSRGVAAGDVRLHGWAYDLADAALRGYDADVAAFVRLAPG